MSTPVVVQVPGSASAWEADAGIAELARIAATADDLNFDFLTCSEHVAIPTADAATRGAVYFDPLATLSFLAARTTRIRLATSVLVLAYHHPLQIAKQFGTLDAISDGRLVLGVGIGSLEAEFDLIGASWRRRSSRADDAIRALRASLSEPEPVYDGPSYSYAGVTVRPHAVQSHVPIWVGGRSIHSLRRAVLLADGWMPFGLRADVVAEMLGHVTVPPSFDIILPAGPMDPDNDPDGARRQLEIVAAAGATAVTCSVTATSVEHYCDQLALLAEIGRTLKGESN